MASQRAPRGPNGRILSVTQLPDGETVKVRWYPNGCVKVDTSGRRVQLGAWHGGRAHEITLSEIKGDN